MDRRQLERQSTKWMHSHQELQRLKIILLLVKDKVGIDSPVGLLLWKSFVRIRNPCVLSRRDSTDMKSASASIRVLPDKGSWEHFFSWIPSIDTTISTKITISTNMFLILTLLFLSSYTLASNLEESTDATKEAWSFFLNTPCISSENIQNQKKMSKSNSSQSTPRASWQPTGSSRRTLAFPCVPLTPVCICHHISISPYTIHTDKDEDRYTGLMLPLVYHWLPFVVIYLRRVAFERPLERLV